MALLAAQGTPTAAQEAGPPYASEKFLPYVAPPPKPGFTPPAPVFEPYPEGGPLPAVPPPPREPVDDGITQIEGEAEIPLLEIAPPDALSAPIVNVPGVTANAFPPDTIHDVGPNHVVQMTNNTGYIVFDKQGNPIGGATANAAIRQMGALWPAGDVCSQYDTDPIVVYDHLADRWLMAQVIRDPDAPGGGGFNPPGPALCIAVSTTPDPTSTWFAYTFDDMDLNFIFPDYEKIGVWPDGYYMSSYEGSNLGIFVFDRASMLTGSAAGFIKTTISSLSPSAGVRNTRILPADLDGPPPPVGTPNYFVRTVDGQQDTGNPVDRVEVWTAATDWTVPSLTFTLVDTLTPAPFQIMVCDRNAGAAGDNAGRDCVPQPNGQTVDALSNRPMMQLKYRYFGTHEAMVVNQTIDVSGSIEAAFPELAPLDGEVAGVRWYELRDSGGGWAIQQQGTYAPQPIGVADEDGLVHRWMGSIAMDRFGSLALGYSISNADAGNPIHPGIRYTGRRYDDLPGLLPQNEQVILNGPNSQNGLGGRWGDYSAMTVDPVDDCTFWYTQHVAQGGAGKPTQIASFAFNECSADLSVTKSAEPTPGTAGTQITYTITVENDGLLDATGIVVTDTLPDDFSFVADSLPGAECVDTTEPTIVCNIGDLAAGDSTSFTITAAIASDILGPPDPDGPSTFDNTVTVDGEQNDPDESNNEFTLSTLVNELADLSVAKVCKPDEPAVAGEDGLCEIFVDNNGPSMARNVALVDEILSEIAFNIETPTTDQGSCSIVGDNVECDLGDIDAGERVTVVVTVNTEEGGDVNDRVTVSSDTPDPNSANNADEGSILFAALADVGITKSVDPTPDVVAGTGLTYTIEATNYGPSTAVNVQVADVLPAGLHSVNVTSSTGSCVNGVPGDPAQPAVCTFDSIAFGGTETMWITAIVDAAVPDGTVLSNSAAVSADTADTNNANDIASAPVTVQAVADLSLSKSDSPDPALAGAILTYEYGIHNAGPSAAVNVALVDLLPAEVAFVSYDVTNAPDNCYISDPATNELVCEIGNMAPGQNVSVSVDVMVDPSVPHGTPIVNNATVGSETEDDDPSNNSASAETTINTAADLWIDKTGNFETGNPSTTIIYFLTVYNRPGESEDDPQNSGDGGPSDAQNVVVTDALPTTGKKNEPVSIVYLSEDCSAVGLVVTCQTDTIKVGEAAQHEIHIQVSGKVESLNNVASFTSDTFDPIPGNNSDSLLMVVKGGSDRPGGPGGGRGRGNGGKN